MTRWRVPSCCGKDMVLRFDPPRWRCRTCTRHEPYDPADRFQCGPLFPGGHTHLHHPCPTQLALFTPEDPS